jgi:hypothetical protein
VDANITHPSTLSTVLLVPNMKYIKTQKATNIKIPIIAPPSIAVVDVFYAPIIIVIKIILEGICYGS